MRAIWPLLMRHGGALPRPSRLLRGILVQRGWRRPLHLRHLRTGRGRSSGSGKTPFVDPLANRVQEDVVTARYPASHNDRRGVEERNEPCEDEADASSDRPEEASNRCISCLRCSADAIEGELCAFRHQLSDERLRIVSGEVLGFADDRRRGGDGPVSDARGAQPYLGARTWRVRRRDD